MHAARSIRRRSVVSNITPLVDMAFLLITFFVMTLRLGVSQEQEIELPKADQANTTHESQVLIVHLDVDQKGRVLWGNREWQVPELVGGLTRRRAENENLKIVVRADARSPFDKVQRVMSAAAQAGISKLSLAALKLGDESR